MTRRALLRTFGVLGATHALLGAAACSPVRLAVRYVPDRYIRHPFLVERTLRFFVVTLIPGADPTAPDLARVLTDPAYPFHSFAGAFVADLDARTRRLAGQASFAAAAPRIRTEVVRDGVTAGAVTGRLYLGAVFLAQVSFYAGIYSDEGCAMIRFPGRAWTEHPRVRPYGDIEAFRATALTADGNPA